MLLTGQVHLGAKHDLPDPGRMCAFSPVVPTRHLLHCLKGLASGGTLLYSHPKLQSVLHLEFSNYCRENIFKSSIGLVLHAGKETEELENVFKTGQLLWSFHLDLLENCIKSQRANLATGGEKKPIFIQSFS